MSIVMVQNAVMRELMLVFTCRDIKAQLVQQSGDNARLKIRERELQQEVCIIIANVSALLNLLLHFAWGIAEAKCTLVMCICVSVCLSVPRRIFTLLHGPGCNFGNVGVPSSCALLGRLAIGARVSLLWQHSAEREMSASACTRCMPGWLVFASKTTTCFCQLIEIRKFNRGPSTFCRSLCYGQSKKEI